MTNFQRSTLLFLTAAIALTPSVGVAQPSRLRFMPPPPPPNIGEPNGRGQGGGSRGGACQRYEGITALVPLATPSTVWGITVADYPTLWLYAPQGLAENVPLELVLEDETNRSRYRTVVRSTETIAGVFSLSLTAKPLPVGNYRWSVSISCDPAEPDLPITIQGNLQRIAPSALLQSQLAQTQDPIERASLYATAGIWYDALTALGERRRQANDAAAAWSDLLQQANLDPFAAAPIAPCCSLISQSSRGPTTICSTIGSPPS